MTRRTVLGFAAASAVGAVTALSGSAGSAAGSTVRRGRGIDWNSLRCHLDGDLVLPSDTAAYASARMQSLGMYDSTAPSAVAYCESARDVQTVLSFAQDNAVHTVPRSGGHSFGGYSTTDGMVLDVSRMNQVTTDGTHVTIGAGTQMVDALNALTPHGMALAGGLCPTVGAGGFIQGGGIGHQTRKFGMACDRLVSAEVVLANRRVVRASARENPDLYWALRGNGGGNYGVVTSYTLEPVQRNTLIGYRLMWLGADAGKVIENWQQWMLNAPNDLSSVLLTLVRPTNPPNSDTVIVVSGTWYSTADELNTHIDEFVAAVGAAPSQRAVGESTVHDAMMQIYGCATLTTEQCHRAGTTPEAQLGRYNYYRTRSRMFDAAVPRADVDALLTVLADPTHFRDKQSRLLYFEALGGAANEKGRTDTAYVHRTTKLLAGVTAQLPDLTYTPDDTAACESWLADGFAVLDRHSLRESYQNYMDPAIQDWRTAYYAENYPRLVRVKRAYDPHGFFRFARGIG
ncbi:FAD-binding oxidoreductase [Amycolatopsis sp. OK19-0408]|uniref:FAD-binding oxidoreductase n=1 Tax=Amycolatopsis iheyensis TaxID=2945988 RepID=A0A9X2NJW1_9PSEU|nr:FAD-binding oxidoreductase [Amycolatopsis iheyensis]MCR6488733.1 FAD-binding oxidoreductase [Amycolatopsis iheyensis]